MQTAIQQLTPAAIMPVGMGSQGTQAPLLLISKKLSLKFTSCNCSKLKIYKP